MNAVVPTLLLTGTVGAGKTSVAEEISNLLYEIDVPHACIDSERALYSLART